MHLTVKGKHLDVGDSLRAHIGQQLEHTAKKYFRDPMEATVVISKEKNHLYRADVSIHVGGGIVLQTHHEAPDPYPAFDEAAKTVGKRLSRYKDRLRDHHKDHHKYEPDTLTANYTTLNTEDENQAEGGVGGAVIAEMETQILTLAVSDAVMRLELGSAPALLFRNPRNGGLNMVYRRKDGNIGWVDPPVSALAPVKKAAPAPAPKKSAAKKAAKKPAAKKKPAKAPAKKAKAKKARKKSR